MSDIDNDQDASGKSKHYCGYPCTYEMGRDDNGDPVLCGAKCCKEGTPEHQAYGTHRCAQHQ